jgi:hypothetical protein
MCTRCIFTRSPSWVHVLRWYRVVIAQVQAPRHSRRSALPVVRSHIGICIHTCAHVVYEYASFPATHALLCCRAVHSQVQAPRHPGRSALQLQKTHNNIRLCGCVHIYVHASFVFFFAAGLFMLKFKRPNVPGEVHCPR